MFIKPQRGDLQISYLMKMHAMISEIGVKLWLHWVLPLVLLSLCLRVLYAQIHDSVHVKFCWHLITFQTTRDEVKGFYPLAYEDMNTEARFFAFWILIRHNFVLSAFFWILSVLQLFWDEPKYSGTTDQSWGLPSFWLSLCMSATGIRTSHCFHDQWPEITVEVYDKVLRPRSRLMIEHAYLFSGECTGTITMYKV